MNARNDQLLPTTMVGSYPRPKWFRHQLDGRDVLRGVQDCRARRGLRGRDACRNPRSGGAGLDVVTDGQMWFDDIRMGIGSFLWYWLERIGGFEHAMRIACSTVPRERECS